MLSMINLCIVGIFVGFRLAGTTILIVQNVLRYVLVLVVVFYSKELTIEKLQECVRL